MRNYHEQIIYIRISNRGTPPTKSQTRSWMQFWTHLLSRIPIPELPQKLPLRRVLQIRRKLNLLTLSRCKACFRCSWHIFIGSLKRCTLIILIPVIHCFAHYKSSESCILKYVPIFIQKSIVFSLLHFFTIFFNSSSIINSS